jgi:pyruvate ferredoxin oxidoreductase gamma subunit
MPPQAGCGTIGTVKEALLVGRGGEGVVLASQFLAETFAREGFAVQAFPEFTAERRGAPISAFVRWDRRPIHRRFKVRDCDVALILSPGPPPPAASARLRAGGLLLVNRADRLACSGPFDIARTPAARIARELAIVSADGRPMGNIALLGAAVRLLLPDALDHLEAAVRHRFPAELADANIAAARIGFASVIRQRRRAGDVDASPSPPAAPRAARQRFPVSTTDSRVNHTGDWALDRPVLTNRCTACALCVPFCPEGAISRSNDDVVIDYLYCKGCGICQVVCPVSGAVELEEVAA